MQAVRQLLLKIQMFLAPRRVVITKFFFVIEIILVLFWGLVTFQAELFLDEYFSEVYEIGRRLGQASLILYVLTVIPGIITRLQWWPLITQPIGSIIHPLRRHLGILMFLTAWIHMSFTTSLPQLVMNDFDPLKIKLETYQWMGQISWWLLFPLWLTSNDLSMRFLGKWWKRLHRLTYIALFFIFLHVAIQGVNWMYLMGAVMVLQVTSWIRYWLRMRKLPTMVPPPIRQSPTSAERKVLSSPLGGGGDETPV